MNTLDTSRFNIFIGENFSSNSILQDFPCEIFTTDDAIRLTRHLIIPELNKFTLLSELHLMSELFDWLKYISFRGDDLEIKDHFIDKPFTQQTVNKGFLAVLFYIALIVSDDTPKIFAIDNIDTSLNPKLCTKIIKELIRLAKKYDKQVFVTTHNPAILDGIDLGDDEQRLFVVSRNKTGYTRFKRITLKDKPVSSARARMSRIFSKDEQLPTSTKEHVLNLFDDSEEPLKLSEAFLRGYLGGLPKSY